MIQSQRIKKLNDQEMKESGFVIYWMQQSQRTHYNHALEYAITIANEKKQPLLVYFGITDRFPEANLRHYQFMLQGLKQVEKNLSEKNIRFILRVEHPVDGIKKVSDEASVIVVDRGYLRVQREWRKKVATKIECPLIQVESEVVIPVETASDKEEYAAYTLRPKIKRNLSQFLRKMDENKVDSSSLEYSFQSEAEKDFERILSKLSIDTQVHPVSSWIGGEYQAKKRLDNFLKYHLMHFDEKRNHPTEQVTSQLSPYLHFGNISPLYTALQVNRTKSKDSKAFLEELIVRRELSMNFVYYNQDYDQLSCLPSWAFKTLKDHEDDPREHIYNRDEFESASTHDPYWNAAQLEMVYTGKMHGYMRMYWGKKIIEWTDSPAQAFEIALYLNNKYELDGRDPNGFAGVAWCFGKHDRAWKQRAVFGKVRYMSASGLERKNDMKKYVAMIENFVAEEHS